MKKKTSLKRVDARPAVDLDSINNMLKNSFGAIKIDMIHLKESQEEQMHDMSGLKKDFKSFRHGCATKDDIKRIAEKIAGLDKNQKLQTTYIEKLQKYSDEIVQAVNDRIKELNKEFDKIMKVKDDLKFKLNTFERLESDFMDFKKTRVKKEELKKFSDDTKQNFKEQDMSLASKKDLLKLAKRIEKLEKKK